MKTPTDYDAPVFLMNFPLSVSNKMPNNPLMEPRKQGTYNLDKAIAQWIELYRAIIEYGGLVYVLPGHDNLQDLPFVANLGAYLPHLNNTILLANFMSAPRRGEDVVGRRFFKSFDYRVRQPLEPWEGEADLKWLRSNIYFGGVGIRSTAAAYRWMRKEFHMEIIEIAMIDPKLYHLDCVLFPLTETKVLVNTAAIHPEDFRKLDKVVEIIPVPKAYAYQGWTNCVRIGKKILHAPADLSYEPFAEVLADHGFDLRVFDLSEFDKSGADLSCLCMHMNAKNRF